MKGHKKNPRYVFGHLLLPAQDSIIYHRLALQRYEVFLKSQEESEKNIFLWSWYGDGTGLNQS